MIEIGKVIKAKCKENDRESLLMMVEATGLFDLIRLDDGKYIFSGTPGAISEYLYTYCDDLAYCDGDVINALAEQKAKQIMIKYVENIFNNENKSSYETLARKIISRFTKIGIVSADNAKTQFMKVTEELGELAEGINKDKPQQIKDSLGDVLVTLILLAEDLNLNLLDCLNSAWGEIKDRKGEVKDGSFVKEEDLND